MADRTRWIALYVLCAAALMIVLDSTVVNVALPSIQKDLGFTQASLAWVVNAYLIAFGGLLLLCGRLGDLLGRRRMFVVGLGLFTAASLACGLSQTQEMLIVARFVQGIGGATASAVTLGMIVTMFTDPRDQAKAIGVFSFVAAAGASVGLLLGGIITQTLDWHWIFIVNVPIGIVTIVAARRLVPADQGIGMAKGADLPGAVLITSALMLGVYTIVHPAAIDGWTDPTTLLFAALSLALLGGFVLREHLAAHPLVPLRVFRSRNVAGANLTAALVVCGMFGLFFLGALYMQGVLGYDALETGLAFLPTSTIIAVISLRYSERLITGFGARRSLIAGSAIVAVGLVWFARVPVDGNYWIDIFPAMVLLGLGNGMSFPSLMSLSMSGATPQDAGLASGLIQTMFQVGGALGLAVLATLSANRTASLVAQGESAAAALVGGYHLAFLVGLGVLILAILVAALVIQPVPAMAHAHAPSESEPEPQPATPL